MLHCVGVLAVAELRGVEVQGAAECCGCVPCWILSSVFCLYACNQQHRFTSPTERVLQGVLCMGPKTLCLKTAAVLS